MQGGKQLRIEGFFKPRRHDEHQPASSSVGEQDDDIPEVEVVESVGNEEEENTREAVTGQELDEDQGGSTALQANIRPVQVQGLSGEIEQHIEQDSTRWRADSMQNVETGMVEIRSMLQDMAAIVMVHGEAIQRLKASIDALATDVQSILSNQGGSTAPQANIRPVQVQCISGEIEQHIEQDSTRCRADSMQNVETGMVEMRSMLQDMAAMVMVHGEAIERIEASVEDTQQRVRSLHTPITITFVAVFHIVCVAFYYI